MSSLIGRQIVVTRAIDQAAALSDAIREAGGSVVAIPLLEIVDVEDGGVELREAIAALTPDDWLVVLSPNGANRVVDLVTPNQCSLAVIASGTAKVFEDAGWTVHLRPDMASSEGLLSAFDSIHVSSRVLIAQAKIGRPVLADGLRERGLDVSVVAAYRNVMPELSESSVALARAADTVVFASPSAVDRYVEHVGDEPRRAICIGGVTAATALASGFDVTIAPEPTVSSIVGLLSSP
jgi:uroporphyrinogen-III synthase